MVSITEYSTEKILGFRRLNSFSSLLLPEPILKKGSVGNEVVKLQNILNKLNYPCGKADGIFGINTEKVLMQFQKDNMLKVDGIYGKETHECLYSLIQKDL